MRRSPPSGLEKSKNSAGATGLVVFRMTAPGSASGANAAFLRSSNFDIGGNLQRCRDELSHPGWAGTIVGYSRSPKGNREEQSDESTDLTTIPQ